MKKTLLLLSLVAIFFASTSSGGERVLDTPAERLIGHWATTSGDNLYYAKPKADGLGNYILVQPNGNTAHHHYKIISQIPKGERVMVRLLLASGDEREETYMITQDGEELVKTTEIVGMNITSRLKYVDDKEAP